MSGSQGRLTLDELRSSSFYSGNGSLPIQDFIPQEDRHSLGFRVLRVAWRVIWRVTWVFAWLALLDQLGSVPLWLGILAGYLLLLFLLSRLLGGTRYTLPQMLVVLL